MSRDEPIATLAPEFTESESYRGMNRAAVAAFVLGLGSTSVMTGAAVLIFVPLAGLFCGLYALRQLADSERRQIGRPMALAGVGLSTIFLVAGPCHWWMDGRWLSREARPIAEQWFEYLRRGQPQWANQFEQPAELRRPFDNGLIEYYRSPESYEKLKGFVKQPLVRLMLELKDQARVRFCQTLRVGRGPTKDQVSQLYAITFPYGGQSATIFAFVELERRGVGDGEANRWMIIEYGVASPITDDLTFGMAGFGR